MKTRFAPALAVTALLFGATATTPTAAQDRNEALCGMYGTVGAAVLDTMLPVTLQEIIAMARGENAELTGKLTRAMLENMTNTTIGVLALLKESEMELLGEAAGEQVMGLAMAGQVASGEEARQALTSRCLAVGADNLLAQQQRVRRARSELE